MESTSQQRQKDLEEIYALERQEWIDSLEYVIREDGIERAQALLKQLHDHLIHVGAGGEDAVLNTPYRNTIPLIEQPPYPGEIEIETKIENIIRWNAMAMVLQAFDSGTGVGGHIATFGSAATMMEVGYHHFFRNRSENFGGDVVSVQPHASPGTYARAFLEGRLTEEHLKNFRRELQKEPGLCSYPHPRQMPQFWQMPSASMGLSVPSAIYQARFIMYLERRRLKPNNGGTIWSFIGDGETDEPEVLGTIGIAAREKLDNLILVVNCNLQRLDGPVRGNGKIIQELERSFRGAGWRVIKVIWGGGWDPLLAQDHQGVLQKRMDDALDGDYQMYSVSPGDSVREHWVENNPELRQLMANLSDEEVRSIKRGGQDPKKIFAAFHNALQEKEKPTVILVKTMKGDGMGKSGEGKNTAHQKKQMSAEERIACAKRLGIPISEEQMAQAAYYKPPEDSEEIRYLKQRRRELGGYLPTRTVACPVLRPPDLELFQDLLTGSSGRSISTTTAFVRLLSKLLKDKEVGRYVVPIVPDEARTFGMETLFREFGIYSPAGQKYHPVDEKSLTPYQEKEDGQILEEGICETGAMASFLAAGTAYANHGVPVIPFYIFYSIFGFQRVGDMIWACGDMLCRGFLLGGTSGRTTLNGEGLQHQDGHSHIVANTIPNMLSYDPAFAYELAVIIQEGIRRMYQEQENIFYYITVGNENYEMPAMPDQASTKEGILKGIYCFQRSPLDATANKKVHLLGSGAIMTQVLEAQKLLEGYGVATDIWSVTSYNELNREALAVERWNMLHPQEKPKKPYLAQIFQNEKGVLVAASDYMKALPNSIKPWIAQPFTVLGTDGYGISDSRPVLRNYFEVSTSYIVWAALTNLYQSQQIPLPLLKKARETLAIDPDKTNPFQ